jgi:UDP-N-acetylmuramoylalanine--D-glutamate ligase
MNEFRHQRISVIGAARSGVAAAQALARRGAEVLLSDSQSEASLGAERRREVQATGARWVFGAGVTDALPEGTELVVTSPGVPRTAPVLREAVRRGLPVWSEIELAFRLTERPIIAVTGTNGKTTTTLLIAAMLRASGKSTSICGNVSADEIKCTLVEAAVTESPPVPLLNQNNLLSREEEGSGILVAEISSFQLEWVEQFAPKVAVLTNISPDHLNRHAHLEEYAQTKARIFAAQSAQDWAILNYDDPIVRAIGESGLPGRRLWFTLQDSPPESGPCAWMPTDAHADRELAIRIMDGGKYPDWTLRPSDIPPTLPGRHSLQNILAAAAAALALGADPTGISEAIADFKGVPHRMELVAEISGVRYINNSMCTNVAAAISSLQALDRPAIVLAGGADKGLDFAPLTPVLCAGARHLILIGAAADKMESTFRAGGYQAISRADTLEAAVAEASRMARSGETVILSPACASFDMFQDFEARGAAFRQAVSMLKEDTL